MKLKLEEKHLKWGFTAFLVISASILVFFAIYRFNPFMTAFGVVLAILMPFIYGLAFAYLLCPAYNLVTRGTNSLLQKIIKNQRISLGISKGMASLVSVLLFFAVIAGFGWMIIPGLVDSIIHVAKILPGSAEDFVQWLGSKTKDYPMVNDSMEALINQATVNVTDFLEGTMISGYMDIATTISTGIYGFLVLLKNVFVGIVICVYFLNSKELFAAQSKKLILAVFKEERANRILAGATFTNRTFGGFINGKLLDSLIVGILCFIFMKIFGWEYALLISCIMGISNMVPFFGPIIGAIPSILLLLMVDPMQALYFTIFIIILQQIHGNILEPKILGESTGLTSFWVIFAILVGGGLFGFIGMVLGIPLFAVFYAYFSQAIDGRLNRRGLSTNTQDYTIDQYRTGYRKKTGEKPQSDRKKQQNGSKKQEKQS